MKKRMHLGCLGGQRRFGAAFGEFGCQITRPAAIFCQILTVGPCSWRLVGVVVLAAALCCADCSTEKPSDYPPGTMTGAVFIPINKPLLALPSGQVTPNGGNLPFSITNQIILASNNTIATTKDVENTNKLVLTISKTTPDAISASFANPAEPKQTIKVNGVILQGQTNAQGYFL
jgi:hypothetical protein